MKGWLDRVTRDGRPDWGRLTATYGTRGKETRGGIAPWFAWYNENRGSVMQSCKRRNRTVAWKPVAVAVVQYSTIWFT